MSLLVALIFQAIVGLVSATGQTDTNVTVLTSLNYQQVLNNENIWLVYFYSSKTKRKQNLLKEFSLSADVLKGIIKFGTVEVEGNKKLVETFDINTKSLPSIKCFGLLEDKRTKYYSGIQTAKDLVESILNDILEKIKKQFGNLLQENIIKEVDDSNFDQIITNSKEPWMVLFYAPWCVHCKDFKPIWSSVASTLQNKMKFASLDATTNKIKAREFGIKQYPTIKLLTGTKDQHHVFNYAGARSPEALIQWALKVLPAPGVTQITNSKVFENHCMDKILCIITVLPSIYDCQAQCRWQYLNVLKELGERFKKHEWGWVWTEAGAQKELENNLNIGGYGYPALVVLNPTKMKYTAFKGEFAKSRIEEFLSKLAKARAIDVDEDIARKIVPVEIWDGKDSVNELPEELYLYDEEIRKEEL